MNQESTLWELQCSRSSRSSSAILLFRRPSQDVGNGVLACSLLSQRSWILDASSEPAGGWSAGLLSHGHGHGAKAQFPNLKAISVGESTAKGGEAKK